MRMGGEQNPDEHTEVGTALHKARGVAASPLYISLKNEHSIADQIETTSSVGKQRHKAMT